MKWVPHLIRGISTRTGCIKLNSAVMTTKVVVIIAILHFFDWFYAYPKEVYRLIYVLKKKGIRMNDQANF